LEYFLAFFDWTLIFGIVSNKDGSSIFIKYQFIASSELLFPVFNKACLAGSSGIPDKIKSFKAFALNSGSTNSSSDFFSSSTTFSPGNDTFRFKILKSIFSVSSFSSISSFDGTHS